MFTRICILQDLWAFEASVESTNYQGEIQDFFIYMVLLFSLA